MILHVINCNVFINAIRSIHPQIDRLLGAFLQNRAINFFGTQIFDPPQEDKPHH